MMGAMPTDADVIQASWSDPWRFAVIFDRHFVSLHRYLRRRLAKDLADELAAETFARAFESRRRYDLAHPNARPWLFGIAANLLRRYWRTERRRLVAEARMKLHLSTDFEVDSADERLEAEAAAPQLAKALATLSPSQREVLLLFAWADLSYDEIGRALDLPIGTVQSRLSRARGRLREQLSEFGQQQGEVGSGTNRDRGG